MYAIELPKELLGRLVRLRAITGKPVARLVREAVQDYLERERSSLVGAATGSEEDVGDGHATEEASPS